MAKKNHTIRETDDEARALARRLVSSSRHGSLAVLLPQGGHPFASRTAVANDINRTPVILVSALSEHTAGLSNDPRVSLLLGEPGKGDPLAHPRITLQCQAEWIDRKDDRQARLRARFLRRHPKSALYVDFPDFAFFRLNPVSASLNGGFGKAYHLLPEDFLIKSAAVDPLADLETSAVKHMNNDHADAVAVYARIIAGQKTGKWSMSAIDAAGFDLISGDRLARIEFDAVLQDSSRLAPTLAELAKVARESQG
ncbi:MAG: HugZ family protein [Hyphomicrobiales bacterium]|nr:HugZ family protein [Hyphomicrobiales bacterium]MCP4999584.1 HugZ family protein [Hyphomicrobiales bacterium]